jgi:hypothetical protein
MEDTARMRKLVRLANRQQVLTDLLKATAGSVQNLMLSASSPGVPARLTGAAAARGYSGAPAGAPIPEGSGESATPRPAEQSDPLSRLTVTRGTVLGILDRLDDALEHNEQIGAQAAANELRHLVDALPL